MLDVRKPIGLLFTVVGAMLTIFSVVQPQITTLVVEESKQAYQLNLNLPCGASMLVFGLLMLALAAMDAKRQKPHEPEVETPMT
jgi:hypothetical protein